MTNITYNTTRSRRSVVVSALDVESGGSRVRSLAGVSFGKTLFLQPVLSMMIDIHCLLSPTTDSIKKLPVDMVCVLQYWVNNEPGKSCKP